MVHHAKREYIDIILIYGLSVCCIVGLSIFQIVFKVIPTKKQDVVQVEKNDNSPVFDTSAFSGVEIEGRAYVVYDITSHKVISSHNENTPLPLASLSKVMTAISATLHKSKNSIITINQKSIDGNYDLGLKNQQEWKLSEILKYTLIFSSNDGAQAIADSFGDDQLFINYMNNDAQKLGLKLSFTDPAGLDLDGKIGGMGTALDTAKLFEEARKTIPEILDATTKKRLTVIVDGDRISGIPNTNQEIENFPGAEASKTGYTDLAGGNLGVIVDVGIGRPVVIVVLGSTREGRFKDVETLYNALRLSVSSGSVKK